MGSRSSLLFLLDESDDEDATTDDDGNIEKRIHQHDLPTEAPVLFLLHTSFSGKRANDSSFTSPPPPPPPPLL
jgi:hypothetical protein